MKFGLVIGNKTQGFSFKKRDGSLNRRANELAREVEAYIRRKKHEAVSGNFKSADVIVTLGGDGTLLHAACKYVDLGVPFVGINVGTLGFLTAEEGDNWQAAIDKLMDHKYVVSERMTVEAVIGERRLRAVNEIVVRGTYRVVGLDINVGGQKFLEIVGDGVIVSTQTGSTAYSLSSGGPIVDPDLDCLLITPINSIGLPIPSVVLSPNDVVEIGLDKGEDISLIADGQDHTRLEFGDTVKITKGEWKVKFVYFDDNQFIKSLNAKFGLEGRLVGK